MSDIEKKVEGYDVGVYSAQQAAQDDVYDPSQESLATRLGINFESFKRAPGTTRGLVAHGDIPPEYLQHDNPLLQQKMKPRHLQMIAVGGSIGTGLFVGSGSALARGGPAAVLLAWIIMGVMLINVTQALGEMAILYPVSGGFYTLASRMLDPSFAFAMGWNYVLQWAVVLPLEITVAGTTVQYWDTPVPLAAWITIFMIVIFIASAFGTLGYAEEEFWSSCLKLLVVVIFIFIGIICICGGGPAGGAYDSYVGGRNWQNPGAFANGFKGVCAMFVTAAFSFAG
jgi:amino acid transporter